MRYALAITSALLLGGATATLALQPGTAQPGLGQTAQNEPGAIQAAAPRSGAPMSFADMVARLQPAVVNISTKQTITVPQQANPFQGTPFGDLFGGQFGGQGGPPVKREGASLGSGFIISPDGYVVTNNHVIAAGAKGATVDSITVTLTDRKEYVAKLVGRDPASDLAVLKITAPGQLPFVKFGDSSHARVGDWVIAIGEPFGLGGTVTAGIISAINRVTGQLGAYDRFIQTDAAINQGNSGGPMFDMQGNVIGINSQIFSQSGGNIGIGFAIPAESAKPVIATLMKGGSIQRGYIGIRIGGGVDDDAAAALGIPKNQGELVAGVEPAGPAAKAGLKAGDVVTRVNGQPVNPDQTLSYLVANVKPGSTAKLDVIRNNQPVTLNIAVATRPSEDQLQASIGGGDDFSTDGDDSDGTTTAPASSNVLGLTVQPLTPAIARSVGVDATVQGVVIAQVDPQSDAAAKQLKRGDIVSAVNGAPVKTAADLARAVAQAKAAGRPQVLLLITRQKLTNFVAVKIKG